MVKILVVEDHEDMQEIYRMLLTPKFDLVQVFNVQDARQKIRELTDIDLIILDMILPDEPGEVFLKEIISNPHKSEIPVLIVSVLKDYNLVKTTINDNKKISWVEKPFDERVLLQEIKNLT